MRSGVPRTHSPPTAASPVLPRLGGATFPASHRLLRLAWHLCWLAFAAWTPHQMQPLRRLLLEAFGARIHPTAMVRGSVRIWWPGNLAMEKHTSLGPNVICYNVAPVTLHEFAIVSQRAHLCTGTHDVDDGDFPLKARPIEIGSHAWVAAESFVGPGVMIGEGAVLGARGVAARSLDPWTIYVGNPAKAVRKRKCAASPGSAGDVDASEKAPAARPGLSPMP